MSISIKGTVLTHTNPAVAVGGIRVIALRCRRNVNTYPAVAVGGMSMAALGVQVEFSVMGLYLELSWVHNNNEGIIMIVYFQEAWSKWTTNRGSSPGGTRAHDGQGRQNVASAEAGGT